MMLCCAAGPAAVQYMLQQLHLQDTPAVPAAVAGAVAGAVAAVAAHLSLAKLSHILCERVIKADAMRSRFCVTCMCEDTAYVARHSSDV
jgi:hypothetical protein